MHDVTRGKTQGTPLVGIIMGSASDWPVMQRAGEALDTLGVPWEAIVASAHRAPRLVEEWCTTAIDRGLKVIIAGAGGAAALPGVCAAQTRLPVLGVPVQAWALDGLDSLLSIAQMPRGIPVGTLAIGKTGASNAGLMAAAILALSDENIAAALDEFRRRQSESPTRPDAGS